MLRNLGIAGSVIFILIIFGAGLNFAEKSLLNNQEAKNTNLIEVQSAIAPNSEKQILNQKENSSGLVTGMQSSLGGSFGNNANALPKEMTFLKEPNNFLTQSADFLKNTTEEASQKITNLSDFTKKLIENKGDVKTSYDETKKEEILNTPEKTFSGKQGAEDLMQIIKKVSETNPDFAKQLNVSKTINCQTQ